MKFENIDVQECGVIAICGIGLVLAVLYGNNELAMAIGGGLVGYLGGTATKGV